MINTEKPIRPRKTIPVAMRYPGSKAYVMSHIVRLLPRHQHFVSTFGGSGAEILRKPRAPLETFNDLNEDVCNLFRVLREEATRRQVRRMLAYTPHSRVVFEECLGLLHGGTDDPVRRAWAFLVVGNQTRAGSDPSLVVPSSWGYRKKFSRRDRWPLLPQFVERIGDRFRDVQIECASWELIFDRYDSPEALFMCDPPYPFEVRTSDRKLYRHEMTVWDHERLLEAVRGLRGFAVVCSYENDLYCEMLEDWRRIDIQTRCVISPRAAKPARTEVVWTNFE